MGDSTKTGTSDETTGKGNVYITIHKLGSDQQMTFKDGDTVEHLIQAVAASGSGGADALEIRISGKDVREMDKSTTVGSLAGKDSRTGRRTVAADVGSRRGGHGC